MSNSIKRSLLLVAVFVLAFIIGTVMNIATVLFYDCN